MDIRSTLVKIGKKLWPFIRTGGPIVLALGFGLLVAAIWWLGPTWEWREQTPLASWQTRALATLGLVLIVAVLWGWILSRRLKKVDQAQSEAREEEEDPILVYERRQTRLLNRNLASLRDNIRGRNRIYRLPWYLAMGLEDAGKTSLIQRSGQTFTLTNVTRNRQTERNPLGFEWWISDDAVVIDPDGELMSQDGGSANGGSIQQRLWKHFIAWLEESRPRRPLNGVILTIDLAYLSSLGEAERRTQAVVLRTRLRELMEQIGSRLPVYVSFTKLDMLHGFTAFFRKLNKAEREKPLGFTFELESLQDPDQWLDQFEAAFHKLVDQVNARVPQLMSESREPEERAAIYSFSRQISGLMPIVQQFLTEMLAADAFSTPALVRGVYFTSVYQEGVPEDAFISATARHYGLADAIQPAQRSGQSMTYFSEKLFPEIIYPEAGLAGDNVRVTKQRRRNLVTVAVAAVVAGLGLSAGWQHYFVKNADAAQMVVDRVHGFLDNYQPAGQERDTTGRNLLEPLDQLRAATLAFGDYRNQWPLVADMGLYQGDVVGPEVDKSYLDMLSYQFLPALMSGVMHEMNQLPEGSADRLAHLRVLRMLYDASGRRNDIVDDYMARYWQTKFPGQRSVQDRLNNHLEYAMNYTDLADRQAHGDVAADTALAPFQNSVKWAQDELGQMATPDRVYDQLRHRGRLDLSAPLDLRALGGPAFQLVFSEVQDGPQATDSAMDVDSDPLRIPRMLTGDGMKNYFVRESEEITELALVDAWVLGRRADVDFSKADEQQLQGELRKHYAEDYAQSWRGALNHVAIRDFEDLNDGVRVLENLTGTRQPMVELLSEVNANTQIYPPQTQLPEEQREALVNSPAYRMAQNIEQQFEGLHGLFLKDGDAPTQMEEVQKVLGSLHDYLRSIQESPDSGKAALAAARDRLTLEGADPIFTLQRMARGMPAPVDRMLDKVAAESWRVVLDQAIAQLERQWYDEVYQPFQQNLARNYPFSSNAGRDAALQDFERFFAPDGTLDTFYKDKLKLFLEDHPEHVSLGKRATLIRRDVMAAIDQAERIRQAFFTRKGSLDVEFALEPVNLSSNKRRSVMNVDGQLVEFSHGPRQSIPLIWPNTLRDSVESEVTLVPVEVNRSPRSQIARGPWAFFRLLDKADITGVSASAVDVKFNLDGGSVQYRLHAAGGVNPFTQQMLAGYEVPRSLY
ncbi:type VI secretion system membrane subunit TssM [Marinobacter bohaiensis]|uniref:type VI secretion system membrane subunit TssM n=1 Tax=Marinobacter bohaiensis TaxID=2201898 RepID=UPI000DAB6D6C|nr:type VI secretion system membrane subunit TssM [Marinobacter bohaiensis]